MTVFEIHCTLIIAAFESLHVLFEHSQKSSGMTEERRICQQLVSFCPKGEGTAFEINASAGKNNESKNVTL
jgi:hypothetical protein